MTAMTVLANGAKVGTVEVDSGFWKLRYHSDWSAFALSPSLPLTTRESKDSSAARCVEWFFENLLPEGRLRELIARRDRINPRDTWALLARHGQDTAGALSLLTESETLPEESLLPLPPQALQEKIRASRARNLPLLASWDDLRMSLAGTQEKLGARIDSSGAMFLPQGSAPSTQIIKPENASTDFPFCPANEFFCMRLARELRVPVPTVGLLHLEEPVYVIERFDRELLPVDDGKAGGHVVRRIHQIDLCQVRGVAPSRKYESEAGLGLHDLLGVLRAGFIERPAVATSVVLRWIVFNYLIGNLDAHAKNIAFLMRGHRASVAPFYDMLSVEAYLPRQTMSMAIAGENKPGWVEGPHWDALAHEADVAPRLTREILSRMCARLPEALSTVIADERLLPIEREFLRDKVLPVMQERRAFIAAALKSPVSTIDELLAQRRVDPALLERLARRSHGS